MFSYLQAIAIGALQGVTELFPVSSLGHSVILDGFFNWQMKQDNPYFLAFLVATHLATATVLFLLFWKEWREIIRGFFRSVAQGRIGKNDEAARLGWLLIVGTIPAGILGLLFETSLKKLFSAPQLVAIFLILNGLMLLAGERYKRNRKTEKAISSLSWKQSIKIGLFQCLALLPGFSRTGSTMVGGLLSGLNEEAAARFSFLLATPIIGAAAVLKIPELMGAGNGIIGTSLAGAVTAGVMAFLSVKFLEKYFKRATLKPYGIYCLVLGIVTSAIFLFR